MSRKRSSLLKDWSCGLIGEGPVLVGCAEELRVKGVRIEGVLSDCPRVTSWCRAHGVACAPATTDPVGFFERSGLHYLFSIVNHKILSAEILRLPGVAAINYHDSLLPSYAGFNATSWAILDGATRHGITWHVMTEHVDAGVVLVQEEVEIAPDDTAFTLTTKCADAAIRGFVRLIRGLDDVRSPQGNAVGPALNFHLRSERSRLGMLDFSRSVSVVNRTVRGLDFGPDANWMAVPKFLAPNGEVVRVGMSRSASSSPGTHPGTIVEVQGSEIVVAVSDGTVRLTELSTLRGVSLDATRCAAMGIRPGAQLSLPNPEIWARLEALDARVTRVERFWVRRLARFVPSKLAELDRAATMALPCLVPLGALPALTDERRSAAIVAALCIYLNRVGEDSESVRVGYAPRNLEPALAAFFSAIVPFELRLDGATTYEQVLHLVEAELTAVNERGTFASDVWVRYPELRSSDVFLTPPPVMIVRGSDWVPGAVLCLSLDAEQVQLKVDTGALSVDGARLLGERLTHIARAGLEQPDLAIEKLPMLPERERALLLVDWQKTDLDYPKQKAVHHHFEEQVALRPDATALVFRDQRISYADLDRRANAVATALRQRGVQADELVGVCIERSVELMVALLGVLKAGGAYVPLDPAYPMERLTMMLEDSKAKVLLTQGHLMGGLPKGVEALLIESCPHHADDKVDVHVQPSDLAYVIFTSGSTGRPKGVMVQHGNVSNFFAGMDRVLGTSPGVWLAVTSVSFDISVLELFWTLGRGYTVVLQEEGDRASLQTKAKRGAGVGKMDFSLFYFAADSTEASSQNAYRLMLEGARFADEHGFSAVWTPERHFHAFGGLYPNAAVTSAALATITKNVEIRAGSVVLPLHDPIRVAEDWAVVDNLSGGRVGLSFASGWHANDFALKPENFQRRREVMYESIETVLRLWRGEKLSVKNGEGKDIDVHILPRPVRERPPMWIASAGSVDTFKAAGQRGYNVLTNMLGQDLNDLKGKFAAYREARKEAGHDGPGVISVMLHTFVSDDDEEALRIAKGPFCGYLASSYDLVKVAPWMFPAFKQPSQGGGGSAFNASTFDEEDMKALLDHAFERYSETAGLFGTPERALHVVNQLRNIGADEVACLIDFGVDPDVVLKNLVHLDRLRQLANAPETSSEDGQWSIAEQLSNHRVTHFQCTPSLTRMLMANGTLDSLRGLRAMLLGGEALPPDLANHLTAHLSGRLINMYGPTETTIWSTTSEVVAGSPVTIGRPIANTVIRILDSRGQLCPIGVSGELCIGGDGVVRGYLERPELTAERFIPDPFAVGARLYRTGDLARYNAQGELEYLGRMDQQVKFNGYRVELGEIEAIMVKHPLVRQAVVAVKQQGEHQNLVGYIVANAGLSSTTSDQDNGAFQVTRWGALWNEAYVRRVGQHVHNPRFDISGWLSSFTGSPLSGDEMREWLGGILGIVADLRPRRVLEIGCGTGMVLFGCLAHVEHYTGVDLSTHALASIFDELTPDERKRVALVQLPAHEIAKVEGRDYDLVIINSVAQYFPSAAYFADVLNQAAGLLTPRGQILVGDIRSFDYLRAFHGLIELNQAPGHLTAKELSRRASERAANESELTVNPSFFAKWASEHPGVHVASLSIKSARAENEMSLFRYDVVLNKSDPPTLTSVEPVVALDAAGDIQAIERALAADPAQLLVSDILHPRLGAIVSLIDELARSPELTAEEARKRLSQSSDGILPSDLVQLAEGYSVEMRWSATPGKYDALLRRKGIKFIPWSVERVVAPHANVPVHKRTEEPIAPTLRKHLAEFLPAYMIPSTFIEIDSVPLTPNGKIDRKALPAPGGNERHTERASYVVPSSELERTIAQIWQELLGVEKVGTRDNIFEIGASSLLTVEANNLLQQALGKKVPLVNMFRYPTIEKLAAHLAQDSASPAGPSHGTGPSVQESDKQERLRTAAERRRQARARLQS